MKVHSNIDSLPQFNRPVVTIGTFDGVHVGHQQVITQLKKEAKAINGETVIITFHPHPRNIVSTKDGQVFLLNTLDEKIALLTKAGIDHLVIVPFTAAFSTLTAEAYIKDFLWKQFQPHTIIIGHDHQFGKNRLGNYTLLEQIGAQLGFIVKEIPARIIDSITVSSTQIRMALQTNAIEKANELLGYVYFMEGTVVEGNKLGRTIGYPTANIAITEPQKLIPANGVYAVTAILHSIEASDNLVLKGMMNIGLRPTVGGTKQLIEVNIFDFNRDLYGKQIRIAVHHYLRGEEKFANLDALKFQLEIDKLQSIGLLEEVGVVIGS